MPRFKHTRHGSGETNPPLTFLAVLLGSSPTWTCPPCRSETGERVRAGIFDGAFGSHLLVALLPFPLLLGIIALILRAGKSI